MIRLDPGEVVTVNEGIVVKPGVTLDLNGGELKARLRQTNAAGVRLMSQAEIRGGTVTVQSLGPAGSQAGAHAAILVGALYGENPSVSRLSPFDSPSGWRIRNVTVRTDKRTAVGKLFLGAAGIQVVGGARAGLIEGVTVADSDRMAGGILLDWGTVGDISSADVVGSASNYRAGAAYTTHPHDIVIRNISIGRLNRPAEGEYGSFGIRLSAVHDVTVSGVEIAETTEAAILYSGGDLGFEFARPSARARGHLGVSVKGVRANAAGAYLVRTDTFADNVFRAAQAGYRPQIEPIGVTDIAIEDVTGVHSGRGAPGFGVRVDHQRGGSITDVTAIGFRRGFFVDEQVYDLQLIRPTARASTDAGLSVEHPYRPPARIWVESPVVTGTTPASRTIVVGTSEAVTVSRGGNAIMRVAPEARAAVIK